MKSGDRTAGPACSAPLSRVLWITAPIGLTAVLIASCDRSPPPKAAPARQPVDIQAAAERMDKYAQEDAPSTDPKGAESDGTKKADAPAPPAPSPNPAPAPGRP